MKKPILIGVAGGSGSGKTTFARRLCKFLGEDRCVILGQDSYYIDQSSKFDGDGGSVNFDHPDALDFNLMAQQLNNLKNGKTIEVPIYDFATHKRLEKTEKLEPHDVILVDGILILSQKNICHELDLAIFIDVDEDLRFSRRLKRDVEERGRTPEGVKKQFYNQVKPMHDQFVGPSKNQADIIVDAQNFDQKLQEVFEQIKLKI